MNRSKWITLIIVIVSLAFSTGIAILVVNLNKGSQAIVKNETELKLGKAAIELTDEYLNFKISADEAYSTMNDLYNRSKTFDCKYVKTYLLRLSLLLRSDTRGNYSDYEKILEYRNTIARYCGMDQRNN